jgi:hypothetical protein
MDPKIISHLHFKGESDPTLPDLLELAEGMCHHLYNEPKISLPATWLFATGKDISIMVTDWKDDFEQEASGFAIRMALQMHPEMDAYVMISETWMAAYKEGERRATYSLANDPRRLEVLMLLARNRAGEEIDRHYEMKRDGDKLDLVPFPMKGAQHGGRFYNLFKPAEPIPEGVLGRVADA